MTTHEAAAFVLAQSDPGGQGEDFGKSSPLGLLLLVVLLVAVALLIWSMSRHVRRLPQRFDEERAAAAAPVRARATSTGNDGPEAGEDTATDGGDTDGGVDTRADATETAEAESSPTRRTADSAGADAADADGSRVSHD